MRENVIQPRPGQESVWDYPRPPRVERAQHLLEVRHAGRVIAQTRRGWRVLETSHPPTYYFPFEDIDAGALRLNGSKSVCEFKGQASYFDVVVGKSRSLGAAWTYRSPMRRFEAVADHFAFYPALVDTCLVDGETARSQPGGFYGGWITSHVVGPFKGAEGTRLW